MTINGNIHEKLCDQLLIICRFSSSRHHIPPFSFVLVYQLSKENQGISILPQVKVQDNEDITEDSVTTTLRRALSFYSTLQNHDGHWAGDYGGPMFLMPGMVNGFLNATSFLNLRDTFNCFMSQNWVISSILVIIFGFLYILNRLLLCLLRGHSMQCSQVNINVR